MISTTGALTVVADICGFGIAVDSAGNIFIADPGSQRVRKISTDGTVTTIAGRGVDGEFCGVGSVCEGYSGDGGPATAAALSFPFALAVDSSGDVFIADGLNQAVRVLRPVNQ